MKILSVAAVMAGLCITGCSSQSVLPESEDVHVSRDEADKNCVEVGKVTGTTMSTKGSAEEALADLKKDAARKSINYVKILEYSAIGTSVSGMGYRCP